MADETVVSAAVAAWQRHAQHWHFLGYKPLQAQTVLAEYIRTFPGDRNVKPLHVLEKLGRRRVKAIIEALREQASDDAAGATDPATE